MHFGEITVVYGAARTIPISKFCGPNARFNRFMCLVTTVPQRVEHRNMIVFHVKTSAEIKKSFPSSINLPFEILKEKSHQPFLETKKKQIRVTWSYA